jgi:hypothetical protein
MEGQAVENELEGAWGNSFSTRGGGCGLSYLGGRGFRVCWVSQRFFLFGFTRVDRSVPLHAEGGKVQSGGCPFRFGSKEKVEIQREKGGKKENGIISQS